MTCSLFTLIYSIIEHNFIVHSGRSLFHLSSSLSVSYSIKHPGECKTLKLVKCKAFSVIKKNKKKPLWFRLINSEDASEINVFLWEFGGILIHSSSPTLLSYEIDVHIIFHLDEIKKKNPLQSQDFSRS